MRKNKIFKATFLLILVILAVFLYRNNKKMEKKILTLKKSEQNFQNDLANVFSLVQARKKMLFPKNEDFLFRVKDLIKKAGLNSRLVSLDVTAQESSSDSFREGINFSLSGLNWKEVLRFLLSVEKSKYHFLWESLNLKIADKLDINGELAVFREK